MKTKQKITKNHPYHDIRDDIYDLYKSKPLIYLACPYTSKDKKLMLKRFKKVNKVCGDLMKMGLHIFSPISMSHPVSQATDLPGSWEYWKEFDEKFLECSHRVIVLCIDGWQSSIGVAGEIEIAKRLGITVEYINEKLEKIDF